METMISPIEHTIVALRFIITRSFDLCWQAWLLRICSSGRAGLLRESSVIIFSQFMMALLTVFMMALLTMFWCSTSTHFLKWGYSHLPLRLDGLWHGLVVHDLLPHLCRVPIAAALDEFYALSALLRLAELAL